MVGARMILLTLLLALLGATLFPTAVVAQSWDASIQSDDFGDKDTGIAIVQSSGRGFGLRCIQGDPTALVFLTRETWSATLAVVPAKLLIRIDENEAFSFYATLEGFDGGNAFREAELVRAVAVEGPIVDVIKQIESAKSRVSVAIEIGDQRFEPTRFSTRGSTKAISKIRPLCNTNP
jgi:hypothetical protein